MSEKKSKSSFSKNHESMLKLFECPICFRRIGPPVRVCTNGHAVCNNCIVEVTKCPICSSNFSANKNTMLDKIVEECVFPCMYSESGCSAEMKFSDIDYHEQKLCRYRIIKCPITRNIYESLDSCYMEIPLNQFRQHVFDKHPIVQYQKKITRQIPISLDGEVNILQYSKTNSFILEILKVDRKSGALRITYQHVGNAEETDNWIYILEFNSQDRSREIKFRSLFSPFGWSEKDIKKTGRYLKLDIDILKTFTEDGCLVFSLKIKRTAKRELPLFKAFQNLKIL